MQLRKPIILLDDERLRTRPPSPTGLSREEFGALFTSIDELMKNYKQKTSAAIEALLQYYIIVLYRMYRTIAYLPVGKNNQDNYSKDSIRTKFYEIFETLGVDKENVVFRIEKLEEKFRKEIDTYLILGAKFNNIELVEIALSLGAKVDFQIKPQATTPLGFALQHANHEMVKLLISKNANINQEISIKDRRNIQKMITPVILAIQNNDEKSLSILLNQTGNQKIENFPANLNYNPLHAVCNPDVNQNIFEMVLERMLKGQDENKISETINSKQQGSTPFSILLASLSHPLFLTQKQKIESLLKYHPQVTQNELLAAVSGGEIAVSTILQLQSSSNLKETDLKKALTKAIEEEKTEVIPLLANRCQPFMQTFEKEFLEKHPKYTPSMFYTIVGDIEKAKILTTSETSQNPTPTPNPNPNQYSNQRSAQSLIQTTVNERRAQRDTVERDQDQKNIEELKVEIKAIIKRLRKQAKSCFSRGNSYKADMLEAALSRANAAAALHNSELTLESFLVGRFPHTADQMAQKEKKGYRCPSIYQALSHHRIGFFGHAPGKTKSQTYIDNKVRRLNPKKNR